MSEDNPWAYADLISDRIVDLANEERRNPEFTPLQFLAGLLLGLIAFQRTAHGLAPPREFAAVHDAAASCLRAMASSADGERS